MVLIFTKNKSFRTLISELLKINHLNGSRLHYLYPANFPAELIELMKDNPRICRYIDIPIQHISDKMLRLMKRSHNGPETEALLNRLRMELPDAVIRTTLIAGHPGETPKEYNELKNFVKSFRFNRLGVFAYSHEEDTYSYNNFKDDVKAEVKRVESGRINVCSAGHLVSAQSGNDW